MGGAGGGQRKAHPRSQPNMGGWRPGHDESHHGESLTSSRPTDTNKV